MTGLESRSPLHDLGGMKRPRPLRHYDLFLGPRLRAELDRRRRRKPPRNKGDGSETVLVEPDRPKLGSGGAEAPLEFDDRV